LLTGQPFSTSRIVDIDATLGPTEPDIERNGYCFTDGVGFAGRAVLAEAARALGHHRGINSQPSAIQFRLGQAVFAILMDEKLTKSVGRKES
jgi:RNA-dependent RNA polymerase